MTEEELIKFKSGVIDVTLPKTDENLDIILRIVEGIKVGTSQTIPDKAPNKVPNPEEKLNREINRQRIAFKSPHNTALFDNWIKSKNIKEFEISDFVNEYPEIGEEATVKIVAYKISHGVLQQLSNTRFRIRGSIRV